MTSQVNGLGVGPKTTQVVADAVSQYTNHLNAYYNTLGDSAMVEPVKSKYTEYSNAHRVFLEGFITKVADVLTARSKDLTLNPEVSYPQSRHEEILSKLFTAAQDNFKKQQDIVANPKSTEKEKNEALGRIDAHNGLIAPFIAKVNDAFKAEWTEKTAKVGTALNPTVLKTPDGFNAALPQPPALGTNLNKGWTPNFTQNE